MDFSGLVQDTLHVQLPPSATGLNKQAISVLAALTLLVNVAKITGLPRPRELKLLPTNINNLTQHRAPITIQQIQSQKLVTNTKKNAKISQNSQLNNGESEQISTN